MTTKDGGPAFPQAISNTFNQPLPGLNGMSLRDYFAAQVASGMIACCTSTDWPPAENVAEHAYKYADAMIEARSK